MPSNVWKEPTRISADELKKVSFRATDVDLHQEFSAAISEQGFAIVNELNEKFSDQFREAIDQVQAMADEHCTKPIFIVPGKAVYSVDAGQKRKRVGYIGSKNAVAHYMDSCMTAVAPGYKIAIGRDRDGVEHEQCELIREIPPPDYEEGEVQCVHVDAAVRDPQQMTDCMDILRANYQYVLISKGPLSLLFPFDRNYRLVVFPTAHEPAIECLKNFARHYEAAKKAFMARSPTPRVADWKAAWCGCNLRLLRNKFPGHSFDPVCVPVDVGGMLAMSGFLPHCGLPVEGIRGFIAATYEVPFVVTMFDLKSDIFLLAGLYLLS
jgi:hypothetical protein